MTKIFKNNHSGFVDLYYNDALGLKKSIEEITALGLEEQEQKYP